MLDFCAERDIARDIALIKMNYINEAYERMLKRDVTFRFGNRSGVALASRLRGTKNARQQGGAP
jgi:hypothetical protein